MKLKKKSGLIGVVVALSAASLVSVGFASWVISQGDSHEISGTISVDTISDQRHNIDKTNTKLVDALNSSTAPTKTTVVYGSNSTESTGKWLYDTDTNYAENLTFYLKVVVENAANANIADVIDSVAVTSTGGGTVYVKNGNTLDPSTKTAYTSDAGGTAKTGYAGAADAVYGDSKSLVAALPTPVASGSTFNANGECWYTIEFDWGTLFGGDNPFTYYNASGKTAASHGDEAYDALTALRTLLNGANYTITITTK